MNISEEELKRNLHQFLMKSYSNLTFMKNGKNVVVTKLKIEGPIDLKEGDFGDGFNYFVNCWGNITLSMSDEETMTKPMYFSFTIQSEDDSVKAIKDDKVQIYDNF